MSRSTKGATYIQKLFPTVNNEDLLEFRVPPNVKGNMLLSDVMLRFVVKIPQTYHATKLVPQNYFGPKQFGNLEIRINGEAVTKRNCSNEYFLASYFKCITNYNVDYVTTGCNTFGIFDSSNISTDMVVANATAFERVLKNRNGLGDDYSYEIVLAIDESIFSSNMTLPSNTPLDISFERAVSKLSVLKTEDFDVEPQFDTVLALEDVYLIVPYTIYPETSIDLSHDVQIKYDDYEISRFNVPLGSASMRMSNIITGPLPSKLFFGLMPLASYTGSYASSSTMFQRNGLKKVTLYLDGNVTTGYPITMTDSQVAIPYTRFLENTNRYINSFAGRMLTQSEYLNYNCIHSVTFDPGTSGALTFDFEFEAVPPEQLVLIICSVHDRTLQLDKYRNFNHI